MKLLFNSEWLRGKIASDPDVESEAGLPFERNVAMSWSVAPEIKAVGVPTAKEAVYAQSNIPEPIKQYMIAGIDGLEAVHGDAVLVTVTGYGHLCTGKDYDVTSATVEVRKAKLA